MPLLNWSPDLSVGVDALDDDHRQLFALVNQVHDAIQAGCAEPLLAPLFDRLVDYAREHFRREEALMDEGHYPGLAAHREEHLLLATRVHELRRRFVGGSVENLNLELLVLFKTWLTSHIRISDLQYKPYVIGPPAAPLP